MAKTWVELPESINKSLWQRFGARTKGEMRAVFADSGMSYKFAGDRVLVASSPVSPLYVKSLLNQQRNVRADAAKRLSENTVGTDFAADISAFVEGHGTDLALMGRAARTQLQALMDTDPIGILQKLADGEDVSVFRIGLNTAGWRRFAFWQLIEGLAGGANPDTFSFVDRTGSLVDGALPVYPGLVCMGPLMARQQPRAMVYTLHTGVQIAVLTNGGGGFHRDLHLPAWPVGWTSADIGGRGVGAFKGAAPFSKQYSEAMLNELVAGGNRLISHVTDPAPWADEHGVVDLDERLIVWASIRFGLDAIHQIAEEYNGSISLWTAFRALGTLQGIWEGSVQGAVPLAWLFDPDKVRDVALPCIANAEHKAWASQIVDNYELALNSTFTDAGSAQQGQPSPPARSMAELRNLVHGVGGQGRRPRAARLDALRHIDDVQANLLLTRDIAVLWWTAALLAPDRLLVNGKTPW